MKNHGKIESNLLQWHRVNKCEWKRLLNNYKYKKKEIKCNATGSRTAIGFLAYTMSIQQIWFHSGPLSNSTLLIKWLICCLIDESRGGNEAEEHFESQRWCSLWRGMKKSTYRLANICKCVWTAEADVHWTSVSNLKLFI